MTSIEDCGICRCGCPSNDFAAASCDSACTTEYNMMSFLVSDVPRVLTSLVLPTPAPTSTNIFALSAIHFFHWACIFVSASLLCAGSVFFHSAMTDAGAREVTRNWFILFCSSLFLHNQRS